MLFMALPAIPPKPGTSYAAVAQRQRHALFRHQVDNISTPPPIWRRGTTFLSAFFDLSLQSVDPNLFKNYARIVIPTENSLGMKLHQERSKIIAEILFSSEEARTYHCNAGISFEQVTVLYGFPALPPNDRVIRVKLFNLSFLPEKQLKDGIFDMLAPYGIVLEGGIFFDREWFDGTGYVLSF